MTSPHLCLKWTEPTPQPVGFELFLVFEISFTFLEIRLTKRTHSCFVDVIFHDNFIYLFIYLFIERCI